VEKEKRIYVSVLAVSCNFALTVMIFDIYIYIYIYIHIEFRNKIDKED